MSFVIYGDSCFVRDNFVLLCSQVHCWVFCDKALLLSFWQTLSVIILVLLLFCTILCIYFQCSYAMITINKWHTSCEDCEEKASFQVWKVNRFITRTKNWLSTLFLSVCVKINLKEWKIREKCQQIQTTILLGVWTKQSEHSSWSRWLVSSFHWNAHVSMFGRFNSCFGRISLCVCVCVCVLTMEFRKQICCLIWCLFLPTS